MKDDFTHLAEEFVRAATSEQPDRARRLLAKTPALARAGIYPAAVLGDLPALRSAVRAKPAITRTTGGPRGAGWTLLHYVAFSGLQGESAAALKRYAACAKFLLDHAADPNAAWFEPTWPTAPLRALYGACGQNNNAALARVLLAAGAEINDGESLYHAAEHMHRECLEVLLEHGANIAGVHPHWHNTPLFFLAGYSPLTARWPVVQAGIRWLLEQGADPRVPCGKEKRTALHCAVSSHHDAPTLKLFLAHGADPGQPAQDGRSPFALALTTGNRAAAALFRQHGAREPVLSLKEKFLAACFAGDAQKARRLKKAHPGLFQTLDETERLSLGQAAENNNVPAIEAFLAAGFDLAYLGAKDWGATPLHQAAWRGQTDAVRALLARGAPVEIQANPPVQGSPLTWAAHGSANCGNPRGDYIAIVRALVAAGAQVVPAQIEMAAPPVRIVLKRYLAKA